MDPSLVIISIMGKVADMLPFNKEYETVESEFLAALGSPKACVSAIFKLRNDDMKVTFDARCAAMEKPEILTVYHGTSLLAAESIAKCGFDPAYSTTAAYGKGTYASVKPATALTYCKDVKTKENFSMVFSCSFAKGVFGVVGGGKPFPPGCDYSGTADNTILVTPYADAILPKYLICFYKWAV
jgi:hypothetical protein